MKTIYFLTIYLLLAITPGHAQDLNVQVSGFATATTFSDNSWYDDTSNIALNVDVTYEDWAIRGQVATAYENTIRRLVVEKSFSIKPKQELIVQVGRFPRLASFYNTISDAPGTSGMAMLPLGEYNHRMVDNSTYNSLDGVKAFYTVKTKNGFLVFNVDTGSFPLEEECQVQTEATKQKCRPGFTVASEPNNYDIGLTYETGPWTFIGYKTNIELKTNLINPLDKTSVAVTSAANKMSFELLKFGVKYNANKYWLQSELMLTDFKLAKKDREFVSVQKSNNIYVLAGVKWTEQLNSYVSYSYGSSDSGSMSTDNVFGSTYTFKDTTISLEHHNGSGIAWKKYLSTDPTWDSWVFSITQRF